MSGEESKHVRLLEEVAQLRQRVAELEAADQDHKRAKEEFARHRAVLQAAIDCLPFNFFAIGPDGRYMLQNAVSKENQHADVVGKRPEEVCPNQDDLAIWLDNNRRAFAGEKVEGEVTLSFTGEERSYYNVIVPIKDGGQLYGILGVNIDITERRRAEEALRKAHAELEQRVEERTADLTRANEALAMFRRFAEASSQGFSMADLDGRLMYLNPALCRILGDVRPEDYVGQHLSICYSEETNRRGREEIEPALKQNGHWEGELSLLSHQGKSIPTWHNGFVIRDDQGSPLRLAVVITDITERKKAEEALRESHDELKVIYDGMMDGLVIFDIEAMQPVRTNVAFSKMFGYSEVELKSVSPSQMHRVEDFPRIQKHFEAVVQGRASYFDGMPMLRKDGRLLYVDVASVRTEYNGRPCVISFFHDVTERRQTQEELERERRTLEHMLRASDHERQVIAYDIHDGLAQYLAAAIMHFDTFAHLKDSNPKQAMETYGAGMMMLRQGHSEARRLINGVRPPILDEAGIVAAISHLIHEQRQPNGPKIEFHAAVEFGRLVTIQENAIYRIVQEGLTNARKYSKSKKVRVEIVQEGEQVHIVIQDWGIGFAPDQIGENCFGLEGIRERARLLGGTMAVESAPGTRTRITVELPLAVREDYE